MVLHPTISVPPYNVAHNLYNINNNPIFQMVSQINFQKTCLCLPITKPWPTYQYYLTTLPYILYIALFSYCNGPLKRKNHFNWSKLCYYHIPTFKIHPWMDPYGLTVQLRYHFREQPVVWQRSILTLHIPSSWNPEFDSQIAKYQHPFKADQSSN